MTTKRVVVTGGLGFIGHYLVERLVGEGHEVVVFDDFSSGQPDSLNSLVARDDLKLVKGDVRRAEQTSKVLEGAESVVHLAAIVSVPRSFREPRLVNAVNAGGTLNVLEGCKRNGVKRMVFASSAAVYGESKGFPFTEESPLNPSSPYAASKVAGEEHCKSYSQDSRINTIRLRLMNIYGKRRAQGPYSGVMTKFAESSASARPIVIYGDGNQTRDFTHVDDAVDAICLCLSKQRVKNETMNIGTGRSTSINELASLFLKISNHQSKVVHVRGRPGDTVHSQADVSKARSLIGYRAKVSLEEGVEEYYRWYVSLLSGRPLL